VQKVQLKRIDRVIHVVLNFLSIQITSEYKRKIPLLHQMLWIWSMRRLLLLPITSNY